MIAARKRRRPARRQLTLDFARAETFRAKLLAPPPERGGPERIGDILARYFRENPAIFGGRT